MQIGRERESTVVAGARGDATEFARQRTLGGERHVGIGCGEDEVDAIDRVEDLGHAVVESGATRLDASAGIGAVSTESRFDAEPHLGSEHIGTVGPVIGQRGMDLDHSADAPGRTHTR